MQCIRCGAEINEGMEFCPTCGAAQNAAPDIEDGRIDNTPQSQQQWQPNEQPPQQQSYGQQQYQRQQPYGQQPYKQQYQQQQPYGQQLYQQPIQQQQGWAQNNVQGMTDVQKKKKSKKPLIISLVVAILIIIGLTVTGIVLIISKNSSTPEKTVESFLEALLDGNVSEAVDEYLHPERGGGINETIVNLEHWVQGIRIESYDDMSSKKLSSSEINSINKKLDYDYEVTEGSSVKVHIECGGMDGDYYVTFIVVDFDGRWYISDLYCIYRPEWPLFM